MRINISLRCIGCLPICPRAEMRRVRKQIEFGIQSFYFGKDQHIVWHKNCRINSVFPNEHNKYMLLSQAFLTASECENGMLPKSGRNMNSTYDPNVVQGWFLLFVIHSLDL